MLSRLHLTTKVLPSMYDNMKEKDIGGLSSADLVAFRPGPLEQHRST